MKYRSNSEETRRLQASAKNMRRGTGIPRARRPIVKPGTTIRKDFPAQKLSPLSRNSNTKRASMEQLRVARARRRAARCHLRHPSQNPNGFVDVDGMDNYDYALDWKTGAQMPELDEATHLTIVVRSSARQVVTTCEAVIAQLRRSVASMQKLLASSGHVDSTTIGQDIATRMETLSRVQDVHTQAVKAWNLLSASGHFYRGLVRADSGIPDDVDAAVYAARRRGFLLDYHRYAVQSLAAEMSAHVRDLALNAIPGFEVTLLRKRLSTLDRVMDTAFSRIKVASRRLEIILFIEVGGASLGNLHVYHFWKSHFEKPLKILRELNIYSRAERLSLQYSTGERSCIITRYDDLNNHLGHIIADTCQLREELNVKAAMAGRTGAFEPYADSIGKQMIDLMKARYQRERRSREWAALTVLRRWGYLPSTWCKKLWAPQSVRSKRRSERREYIKSLSTQLHVTYTWTSSGAVKPWADTIERKTLTTEALAPKIKRYMTSRQKLKKQRGIALRALRKLLSGTLLSYQSRTIQSLRSIDRLASLPETEKPSSITQVGKTITALGFYDKLDSEGTNWSMKMEPLRKDSGESIVRWSSTKGKPMRLLPRHRPRFQATQSMRAPHPTSAILGSDAWDQSVDVLTNAGTNGRSLVGESSISTLSGNPSGDPNNKEHQRTESSDEQKPEHPNDRPDGQNPQMPNESMDRPMIDDSSHESEQERESDRDDVDEDSDAEKPEEEPEEEHTPLTYQIPSDVLETALQAPPQTRASYWSQKLYRGPENKELLLHYCVNMEVSERVANHFLNEKVVGFDIEWKPFGPVDSIKENASLIQLATEDRIALFHIARFPGKTAEQLMPPTLKAVLESSDTYKVGVAVKGDCSRLEKYFDLSVRGVFELSRLHNLVEYYGKQPSKVNNKLVKLSTQVHQHLLLPLHKGEPFLDEPQQRLSSVRESDWSRPLDFEQIHYAAADAYAGFRLFDVMESKRKKLKPAPPIPRLCDYDNKPVPRATPRAKRAKKVTSESEKLVAESISEVQPEDQEEEAYETAAEEFAEEEENEDTDSGIAFEPSESEDSDADYVSRANGRTALNQRQADASAPSEASSRRIGRVAFSRLAGVDPAYPTLPSISAEEDPSSDESEAFDPPPKASRRRRVSKAVQAADVLPANAVESDDEFPDPELEKAFASMDMSEPLKVAINPVTQLPPQAETLDVGSPTKQALIGEEALLPTDVPPPTFKPLIQADTTTHTPEYTLATVWAQGYLSSTIPSPTSSAPSRIRATVSPLRAYHIWHHQRVPLDAIGVHLRDPPLAQSTVSSYIIQAISMEKLEYRDEDLISLMGSLPANLRLGRYGWLSKKLGIAR